MVVPVDGSLRNRADFTMRIGEDLALSGRWRDTERELEHMSTCMDACEYLLGSTALLVRMVFLFLLPQATIWRNCHGHYLIGKGSLVYTR